MTTTSPDLDEHRKRLIRHALGANGRGAPYRNFYHAHPSHSEKLAWDKMVEAGLAASEPAPHLSGSSSSACDAVLYRVTALGARLALTPDEYAAALGEMLFTVESALSFLDEEAEDHAAATSSAEFRP